MRPTAASPRKGRCSRALAHPANGPVTLGLPATGPVTLGLPATGPVARPLARGNFGPKAGPFGLSAASKIALPGALFLALGACQLPAPPAAAPPPAAPAAPHIAAAAASATGSEAAAQIAPADEQAAGWAQHPATPGTWTYLAEGAEKVARFASGPGLDQTLLVLVCRPALQMVGIGYVASADGPLPMHVRSQSEARQLTARPSAGRVGLLLAEVGAHDPLLDAIAFSRGTFAVEVAGKPPLFLPSWPEVVRVVEECRG